MNDKIKQCEFCGDDFVYVQKTQRFCKNKHYSKCEVCGDTFLVERPAGKPRTCSRKCRSELVYIEMAKEEPIKKNCEFCNDEFMTTNNIQKYCNKEHTKECEVCGDTFVINKLHAPPRTCGQSCGSVLTHTEDSKDKRRINSLKKHGTEFTFQAESVKKKIKNSLDNSDKDFRIGTKRWKKMLKDKYNVTNVSKLEHIKQIKIQTYNYKYGVDNPAAMQIGNYKDWNNFKDFIEPLEWDCYELAEFFEVSYYSIRSKAYKEDAMNSIKDFYKYSQPELQLKNRLEKMGLIEGEDFMPHNRTIIKPLELDFYLPTINLAIEISPTYTHQYGFFGRFEERYHYDKFQLAKTQGVELITIFDWHDLAHIEETIKVRMKHSDINTVNISQCIMNSDTKLSNSDILFLTSNGIFSNPNLIYNEDYIIRVIYENKLIALAVFSNIENTSSVKLENLSLKRDYFIPNILNSILNIYTSENKNISDIIAYSDNSLGKSDIYIKVNFKLEKVNKGVLMWHHLKKDKFIKDSSLNKYIDDNYNNKTNQINSDLDSHDIIRQEGFLPIYDCGYKKWRLKL